MPQRSRDLTVVGWTVTVCSASILAMWAIGLVKYIAIVDLSTRHAHMPPFIEEQMKRTLAALERALFFSPPVPGFTTGHFGFYLAIVSVVIISAIGLLAGIGLIWRKEWGRRLTIGLSLVLVLGSLVTMFARRVPEGVLVSQFFLHQSLWLLLSGGLCYWLTRPGVKAQFRGRS